MDKIRRCVGLCTQHNILWDELTVMEHLQLFAAIRGSDPERFSSSTLAKAPDSAQLHSRADSLSAAWPSCLSGLHHW